MNTNENSENSQEAYDILLVDDEENVLNVLKETLKGADRFNCNITTANDGEEAMEKVKKNDHDLILSDYMMPNKDGVTFLSEVKDESPDTVRILITGHGDLEVAKDAINEADIHQYIEKPWDNEEIRFTIYEELKRKEEREKEKITDVSGVEDALKTIDGFQKSLTDGSEQNLNKEKLIFEFTSSSEFNKFSFQLKNRDNVHIEDVHVFESKYIINVGVYPKSFQKIK